MSIFFTSTLKHYLGQQDQILVCCNMLWQLTTMLCMCPLFCWMSSVFCEAQWPVCTPPAGGHVFCLCYLCSYSWQQVLSLTFVGRVFSLCLQSPEGVQQPWLHCTWSPVWHMHWSITLPSSHWCYCTSAGHWLCKLEAGKISMQRSIWTPSVFSYERNFLEQSLTSAC